MGQKLNHLTHGSTNLNQLSRSLRNTHLPRFCELLFYNWESMVSRFRLAQVRCGWVDNNLNQENMCHLKPMLHIFVMSFSKIRLERSMVGRLKMLPHCSLLFQNPFLNSLPIFPVVFFFTGDNVFRGESEIEDSSSGVRPITGCFRRGIHQVVSNSFSN